MKELTDKERIFVLEYLSDEKMNAERAALKAGYSKSVARTKAFLWVSKSKQNPKTYIADYIHEIMRKREAELQITLERVLKEHERLAFSNLPNILEKMEYEISLKNLGKLDEDQKASIQSVNIDGNKASIRLFPKKDSLDFLSKRLEVMDDKSMKDVPRIRVIKNDTDTVI